MKYSSRLVCCFAAAMLQNCTQNANVKKGIVYKSQNTIYIIGRIDRELAERFTHLNTAAYTVIINSPGGENVAAIIVGKSVFLRKSHVIVDRLCLSACSSYILAASPYIYVRKDAIIGFHQTSTAIFENLRAAGRPDLANYYENVSKLELSYVNLLGVSKEILTYPFAQIRPVCFRVVRLNEKNVAGIRTMSMMFVPTRYQFQSWTHNRVAGYWPDDKATLREALSISLPSYPQSSFVMQRGEPLKLPDHLPIGECMAIPAPT